MRKGNTESWNPRKKWEPRREGETWEEFLKWWRTSAQEDSNRRSVAWRAFHAAAKIYKRGEEK